MDVHCDWQRAVVRRRPGVSPRLVHRAQLRGGRHVGQRKLPRPWRAYQGLGFHGGFSDCDLPVLLSTLPAAAFDAEGAEVDGRSAVRFRADDTRLGDLTAVFDAATGVPFELSIERSAGHRFRDRRFPHALPYAGDRVLREIGHAERVVTRWAFGNRGPVPLETTYRERWVFKEGVDTIEVVGKVLTFTTVDRPAARNFHVDLPFFESVDFEATEVLPSLGGGLSWDTGSLGTTGTLRVVPEPATAVVLGSLGVLLLRRRRELRRAA